METNDLLINVNADQLSKTEIKTAIENLNKAWEPVAQKMYQAAQQETNKTPSPNGANGADVNTDANESSEGSAKEGDVEDADFEVVEEEK